MRAYKCDICDNLFEFAHIYRTKGDIRVRFSGSASEPSYDVCKTCAIKTLREIAEEVERIEAQ